ncbi:hypothetical protein AX14_009747, partial [Amanita brunnescens Koide BX004]
YDFTVVNVYNRPARRNVAVDLLIKIVHTLPNLAVVQGDFNLHSPLWDSSVQKGSETALILYSTLSECGMNLMNDEDEPTWSNGRGSTSVIDLLFLSDRLCALEPLVEMSLENRGRSDHALITCLFGSQLPRPGKPYITKESEEEDGFCFFLGTTLAVIPSLGDDLNPSEDADHLKAAGSSWWNEECQTYRDAYKLVRSKENLKAYNAVTRRARNAFFEEKIAIMTAIKRPWEGVRWTRSWAPPPYSTIQVDGVPPSSVEDLFDIMHDQFSKVVKQCYEGRRVHGVRPRDAMVGLGEGAGRCRNTGGRVGTGETKRNEGRGTYC